MDGWVRWLEGIRGNYERRMTTMCDAFDEGKTLVKAGRRNSLDVLSETWDPADDWAVVETTKVYDFVRPKGGMFTWVKFNFTSHPLSKAVALPLLAQALWVFFTRQPYLVLVSPGGMFSPTPEIRDTEGWKYFRVSFAACDEEVMKEVSERFALGARDFWRIKSKAKIDELLEEVGVQSEHEGGDAGLALLTGAC